MTTKLYRLFQPGNPQNRVFLPNFWMKLLKPEYHHPPNHVMFEIHPEMTSHDVREYLTKIYSVPVRDVRLRIRAGTVSRPKHRRPEFMGDRVKEADRKMAYVTLAKDVHFKFPENLLPEDALEAEEKQRDKVDKYLHKTAEKTATTKKVPGTSNWFS